MRTALTGIALVLASPTLADSNMPAAYWANRQLEDPKAEARAQALMVEIRCTVCQGQSIADSDAELAGDMRDLVRRKIGDGESPDKVRDWLVERYGSWISYRPSAEPLAWPLWATPILLLILGGWLMRRRVRMRKDRE